MKTFCVQRPVWNVLLVSIVTVCLSILRSVEFYIPFDYTDVTSTSWIKEGGRSLSSFAVVNYINEDMNGSNITGHTFSTSWPQLKTQRPVPIPGPHPYQGAFDSDGKTPIVHDPYALRRKKRSLVSEDLLDCHIPPGKGPEGIMGYHFLKDHLQVFRPDINLALVPLDSDNGTKKYPYRVLCAIYTYEGHSNQTLAIADTWGARCDGFVAASTSTDLELAKVRIPHLGTPGAYKSIWQKVRSLLVYIYTNFLDEFDFVFLCGDDTYLVVENLKSWLSSKDIRQRTHDHKDPFYGGLWTRPFWRRDLPSNFVYHGGGSGYTLNRAVLKLFVEQGLHHSECNPSTIKSEEDLLMGLCMQHLGVSPILAQQNGTLLQYPTDPKGVIDIGTVDNRVKQFWMSQLHWFAATHNIPLEIGMDAVSEFSISFHDIKTASYMRRVDSIIYRSIESDCESSQNRQPSKPINLR